jgi:arylsulfatase
VPFFAGPRVLNRPHSIIAAVEIPDDGAEGVLICQGTAAGGYSFFVKDGKVRYVHNYVGRALYKVESDDVVPPGRHELRFEFEPTAARYGACFEAPGGSSCTWTAIWSGAEAP